MQELKNLKKEPLWMDQKQTIPATLGSIAIDALLATDPQDKASGEQKMGCWSLARKITLSMEAKEEYLDISVEQVKLVKEKIGKAYGAVVVGPAFQCIEEPPVFELKKV